MSDNKRGRDGKEERKRIERNKRKGKKESRLKCPRADGVDRS